MLSIEPGEFRLLDDDLPRIVSWVENMQVVETRLAPVGVVKY